MSILEKLKYGKSSVISALHNIMPSLCLLCRITMPFFNQVFGLLCKQWRFLHHSILESSISKLSSFLWIGRKGTTAFKFTQRFFLKFCHQFTRQRASVCSGLVLSALYSPGLPTMISSFPSILSASSEVLLHCISMLLWCYQWHAIYFNFTKMFKFFP